MWITLHGTDTNICSARVVMAFMRGGIPLSKLDCPELRSLLKKNGYRLTNHRHMLDMYLVKNTHVYDLS